MMIWFIHSFHHAFFLRFDSDGFADARFQDKPVAGRGFRRLAVADDAVNSK